jgi:hypothetical protein
VQIKRKQRKSRENSANQMQTMQIKRKQRKSKTVLLLAEIWLGQRQKDAAAQTVPALARRCTVPPALRGSGLVQEQRLWERKGGCKHGLLESRK